MNISLPHDFISVRAYDSTRASHDFKIRLPSSSVDAYKYFFCGMPVASDALNKDRPRCD